MSYSVELTLLLAAVAAACAVPGTFLVLRRMALVSDAISHVLLFGIAAAYLVVRDVSSPWLLVGAAASGVLTVALVELLQRTKLVKEDAAIGLVFPALFSLGALMLSLTVSKGTHLDVDQVLLGNEVNSISINRLKWGGADAPTPAEKVKADGEKPARRVTRPESFNSIPVGLVVMTALFLLNAGLVAVFYKELKLCTFDAGLAAALGFAPAVLHYALMTAVSVTAVAAFDAVGPVVVVALFVVPPAAAYLLTDRLSRVLILAVLIGVVGAVLGVLAALAVDANVAGTVATVLGLLFGLVFVLAPGRGVVATAVRRWRQKRRFHETMLAIHLLQHEGTPEEADESRRDGLHRHLSWQPTEVTAVTNRAERNGLVTTRGDRLHLTDAGRRTAADALGGWKGNG